MKLVKSLLLGSAAGLTVVAGAHAADLPVKKAVPVEYVKVCTAHGAGFFYIPGTDTCLRISGRARFQATYLQNYFRGNNGNAGDLMGYQGLGRFAFDARTSTAYGTLRSFIRFDLAYGTGPFLASGTQTRQGGNILAFGVDGYGRAVTNVNIDKAFIQFAGFTAGRASSFFDFYAHDFEMIGGTLGSDLPSTNLLAYTATFGNGFSATLSVEDPALRRTPLFGSASSNSIVASSQFALITGGSNFSPVLSSLNGVPVGVAEYDVSQRSRMPDFVGALRYDSAWGSAQLSAAVHELNAGLANGGTRLFGGGTSTFASAPHPSSEYGWAIQAGLKVNTPFIAPGDTLYLQGAYGEGAQRYVGFSSWNGSYLANSNVAAGATLNNWYADAVLDPLTGKLDLSKSWSVVASFLHYWTPQWRSAVFGSYGEQSFGRASRVNVGLLTAPVTSFLNPINAAYGFNGVLRDTNQLVAGGSLIWSPVRDLDIGVEGVYTRAALQSGRTIDLNKAAGQVATGVNAAGQPINAAGIALPTTNATDTFQVRMRVQRDF
ncbi:porin [Methylobacterium oryzihabitans]|uniref:Porin n=1 Tax=Methylobacterium oryzihabitans TaxID=2499852 RepID=A0A437PFF5_9HYPH|nr:porin [Methylobacterium oryzihabitans]RVU20995.1 porin [Methylobacterium oryzihabitans]